MISRTKADDSRVVLTASTDVADDVRDLIGEGLDEYNIAQGGPYNRQDLWIVARDTEGSVRGGLKAQSDYSWLMIDWLWVDPAWRRRGLGAKMMEAAEEIARQRGCIGSWVQTATYQAPDFYRRLGYVEFGRLDDLLPGHAMIWLRKRFQA